jgi:hypothetical protein
MASSETPPKSKRLDEIVLCFAIGLFLALGVAYMAYPTYYYQHHPRPMIPIYPLASTVWSHPSLVYFFFAGVTALFGFWQTRISRWFGRESFRILFWIFLLCTLVVIDGSWKYALAIRFWTLATKEELLAAFPALQSAGTLVKWGLRSTFAAVFLNFGYALLHRRQYHQD